MEILVTTDGSPGSFAALDAANQFATAAGATLTLVRVLDPVLDAGHAFAPTLAEAVEQTRVRWQSEMEALLGEAGIAATVHILVTARGESTRQGLLRAAEEHQASLIAITTRGSGRMRRALLGSVAMDVLGHSDRPVMVTGPAFVRGVAPRDYRLVITTDGSPGSLAAMRLLAQEFAVGTIAITLLRICWPGDVDAQDETELQTIAAGLPESADVSVLVREMALIDGAAHGILDVSRELGASAIAMATEGYRGAYHVFSGSVALSVVSRAEVPVILAKPGR